MKRRKRRERRRGWVGKESSSGKKLSDQYIEPSEYSVVNAKTQQRQAKEGVSEQGCSCHEHCTEVPTSIVNDNCFSQQIVYHNCCFKPLLQ